MATPLIEKVKGGFQLEYSNNASLKLAKRLFARRKVRTVVSGKFLFVFSNIKTIREFKANYVDEIG